MQLKQFIVCCRDCLLGLWVLTVIARRTVMNEHLYCEIIQKHIFYTMFPFFLLWVTGKWALPVWLIFIHAVQGFGRIIPGVAACFGTVWSSHSSTRPQLHSCHCVRRNYNTSPPNIEPITHSHGEGLLQESPSKNNDKSHIPALWLLALITAMRIGSSWVVGHKSFWPKCFRSKLCCFRRLFSVTSSTGLLVRIIVVTKGDNDLYTYCRLCWWIFDLADVFSEILRVSCPAWLLGWIKLCILYLFLFNSIAGHWANQSYKGL